MFNSRLMRRRGSTRACVFHFTPLLIKQKSKA